MLSHIAWGYLLQQQQKTNTKPPIFKLVLSNMEHIQAENYGYDSRLFKY